MPYINSKTCGRVKVSSKVRVGKVGSAKWRSYCARSAKITTRGRCSKNALQRARWKC